MVGKQVEVVNKQRSPEVYIQLAGGLQFLISSPASGL